ncbi:hypothetical protein LTR53_019875, partial [Teratosphaeriaceae sp. CCFEE 6253]
HDCDRGDPHDRGASGHLLPADRVAKPPGGVERARYCQPDRESADCGDGREGPDV